MSDHLPECNQRDTAWQKAYYSGVECVCDALRACEQRIQADLEDEINLYRRHANEGYAAGVQAARDAVDVALLGTLQSTRDRALAAIDALVAKP